MDPYSVSNDTDRSEPFEACRDRDGLEQWTQGFGASHRNIKQWAME